MMIDNLQGGITILKSGLEGLAIQIFEILLPHLNKLVEKLQQIVDWFANLNPATMEAIVKIGLLAAAIGPLLLIGGKLIAGIGSVIGVLSSVAGTLAVVTTGAAVATPAVGVLAGAFTVLTGPVGLAVAAIAGLTAAGVALYKHMKQESIPAIELFGNEVKTKTFETWEALKTNTAESWLAMQSKIDEHGGGIKGLIGAYTEGYKSVWSSALSTMEEITGSKFSNMANKVTTALDRIKSAIEDAIGKIHEWNNTYVKEKVFRITETITRIIRTVTTGGSDSNYSGTSFFPGGLTMVGELGPELVALPRGSTIYNDHETKQILGGNKGITQNITIHSPAPVI